MALIWETNETPSGEQGVEKDAQTLSYLIKTDLVTETTETVIALLLATVPAAIGSMYFQRISYEHMEAGIYKGQAHYSTKEPKKPEQQEGDDPSFAFDTTGGQEKIWYSRFSIDRFGVANADAPDFQGGINVNKETVEGVDIVVPTFKMPITKIVPAGAITGAYVRTLFNMTGTVNNDEYTIVVEDGVELTFEEGELRFDGCRGSKRGSDSWELAYQFTGSKNRRDLVVGKGTVGSEQLNPPNGPWTIPEVFGWDYLWVNFKTKEDATTKTMVQVPVSVHIERVYEFTDFGDLDL